MNFYFQNDMECDKVRTSRGVYALASLVVLMVAAIGTAVVITRVQIADNGSLQERVLSIAAQLRAPGDENTITVANSSLGTAQHMRYEIQQDLLAGMTRSQIMAAMQQEYGPSVLAAPPVRGFGSVVWVVPWIVLIALLSGGVFVVRRKQGVRRIKGSKPASDLLKQVPTSSADDRLRDYL